MSAQTFFSIVIPTLNEEKYLPRLLTSLSKQTFQAFEVIVVDGHSDDQTVAFANKIRTILPSLTIVSSIKRNVGFQRNLGASHATGHYLVFFDADVRVPRGFLSGVERRIKSTKKLLITTWLASDSPDQQDELIATVTNIATEGFKLIERQFAGGYDIIVQRNFFLHMGGFDSSIVHGEDHEFTLRCHGAGVVLDILRVPKLIYSTRRFRKYGVFAVIQKSAKASVYALLKKPITKAIFDYPMGGQMYAKYRKAPLPIIDTKKFEQWLLKSIKQFISV